jgi:hypothetical protein
LLKNILKPVMALAVVAVLSSPAFAEKTTENDERPAVSKMKGERGPRVFVPMEERDLEKVEKMDAAERDAFFKEKREEFKKMSPDEKKALRDKRKAWFEGLPKEKQDALRARHEKLREEFKARKKAEFEKLPPEEQAKIKERMKEHRGKKPAHDKADKTDGDE